MLASRCSSLFPFKFYFAERKIQAFRISKCKCKSIKQKEKKLNAGALIAAGVTTRYNFKCITVASRPQLQRPVTIITLVIKLKGSKDIMAPSSCLEQRGRLFENAVNMTTDAVTGLPTCSFRTKSVFSLGCCKFSILTIFHLPAFPSRDRETQAPVLPNFLFTVTLHSQDDTKKCLPRNTSSTQNATLAARRTDLTSEFSVDRTMAQPQCGVNSMKIANIFIRN